MLNPFGLRYKKRELFDCQTKEGKWSVEGTIAGRFAELDIAHEWGMTPLQFFALSEIDQMYMAAYVLAKARMQAVEEFELDAELEKARRKANKK